MTEEITLHGAHKMFEEIKKLDEDGIEYWTARELMLVLGYSTWRRFEDVIKRAQQACLNNRQFPQDHFADTGKSIRMAKDAMRKIDDYKLAANLFRITQTEDKLNKNNIKGDINAQRTHFEVGRKVRQVIRDIGGEMPENLKPERHIKDLKREIKVLNKGSKKANKKLT